jgi:Arc/MetJ-type ribon-helix-helix transcriptional regulator
MSKWYSPGMTTKIAVSLPDELAERAREAVRDGRASSVSAYVAAAIAQAERTRGITELVADMRAEDGPPDEADYAWARRALGLE